MKEICSIYKELSEDRFIKKTLLEDESFYIVKETTYCSLGAIRSEDTAHFPKDDIKITIDIEDDFRNEIMNRAHQPISSFDVLGIPVSIVTLKSAASIIISWAKDTKGRFVCIRDVHGVVRALDDARLMNLHKDASMVTPDGMPLVVLGKLAGLPVSRACGPDLIEEVIKEGVTRNVKHYFYGGNEGVAEELSQRFKEKFPGLNVAGYECPPFRALTKEEDEALIKRIIESKADIVWVGLSTPKQEFWMHEHYKKLPATLIGVGAAFDFHTGKVKRAPKWMQKSMLEWLYRLCSEPKRLWRRYLIMAPRFVFLVLKAEIFNFKEK